MNTTNQQLLYLCWLENFTWRSPISNLHDEDLRWFVSAILSFLLPYIIRFLPDTVLARVFHVYIWLVMNSWANALESLFGDPTWAIASLDSSYFIRFPYSILDTF